VEPVMLEQTFTVTGYKDVWLPAAFEPQSVDLKESSVRWDPELTTLVDPDGLSEGTTYTVQSSLIAPSPKVLDIPIDYSASQYSRYIELPDDIPDQIRQVAEQLTAGEPTTFRKVLAIQDYLKVSGGFEYDESVQLGTEATAMVEFLTTARRGFCQQFATTMAVLLRTLRIPSRVAVGFTPGSFDPQDGLYHVSTRNLHVWVEVLFPGFGWLSFEPTPRRTNPVADAYQHLPSSAGIPSYCAAQGCPQGVSAGGPGTAGPAGGETSGDARRTNQEALDHTRSGTPDRRVISLDPLPPPKRFPIALTVVGIVGLLALLLMVIPPARGAWRRMKVRRARQPRDKILAAYSTFESQAADLGLGRRTGETLWEHRMRLVRRVEFSDGHLDRLTGITGRAAYSVRPVDERLAGEAVDAGRVAIRDMRRATPLARQLLGLYRLPKR
jgi:Transglutaminase-like superfamily/Domain of unknown function (DUF4129)